jgi:phosphatidylglycerophosphate synthase
MGNSEPGSNRRPLKSRQTRWAAVFTRAALAAGLTANQISFLGIVVACLGSWALIEAPAQPLLFLAAAACIQLRLLANMLDGLVAVEGGRGGPTGAIWNEFPDRIEDSLFLVAAGYAAALPGLGWLTALLAAICAYVRLLGGTLGQPQDFGGPMAKPHRMAALTIGCLVAVVWAPAIAVALGVIAAGAILTIGRRLARLSKALCG